jgi:hypothetical protein
MVLLVSQSGKLMQELLWGGCSGGGLGACRTNLCTNPRSMGDHPDPKLGKPFLSCLLYYVRVRSEGELHLTSANLYPDLPAAVINKVPPAVQLELTLITRCPLQLGIV